MLRREGSDFLQLDDRAFERGLELARLSRMPDAQGDLAFRKGETHVGDRTFAVLAHRDARRMLGRCELETDDDGGAHPDGIGTASRDLERLAC
jgi:hypothetical protein